MWREACIQDTLLGPVSKPFTLTPITHTDTHRHTQTHTHTSKSVTLFFLIVLYFSFENVNRSYAKRQIKFSYFDLKKKNEQIIL